MLQELSAASLGQHSRTLCLSYSQEKVLHFRVSEVDEWETPCGKQGRVQPPHS